MYAKLISVLGDESSEEGYYSDQMTGKLGEDRGDRGAAQPAGSSPGTTF